MKRENLVKIFNEIKEKTFGDNTSNSDFIDYDNGNSISIDEVEEEYYKYLDLCDEISDYIEDNDLDDVKDKEQIKKHFRKIDDDLFEFHQAVLVDFVEYMTIKLNKQNENQRKANMIFNKSGSGSITTKITIPIKWARDLEFTPENREAIIKLENNRIIIEKNLNEY